MNPSLRKHLVIKVCAFYSLEEKEWNTFQVLCMTWDGWFTFTNREVHKYREPLPKFNRSFDYFLCQSLKEIFFWGGAPSRLMMIILMLKSSVFTKAGMRCAHLRKKGPFLSHLGQWSLKDDKLLIRLPCLPNAIVQNWSPICFLRPVSKGCLWAKLSPTLRRKNIFLFCK